MAAEPELRDYLMPFLDVDDPIVIRMRHEPTEASARLLVSLGAGWIVDEHAPSCVRSCGNAICGRYPEPDVRASAHDLLISRDCFSSGCPREAANGSDHCDECTRNPPRPPVDDSALFGAFDDEPHERRTPMSAVATATCKIEGCSNPSEDAAGPYGRLCLSHKTSAQEARRAENGTGGGNGTIQNGYVARVRALLPAAKSLDQAKRKLDAAGSNDELKEAFGVASRRANGSPTGENLELLEKATKELRRGAPQRDKAVEACNAAERKFKVALGQIAADFRTG